MRCLDKSCSVWWALSNGIHIVGSTPQNWNFGIWVKQLQQRQYPSGLPIFDQIFRLKHFKLNGKYFKSDSTWWELTKFFSTADFVQKMSVRATPIFALGPLPDPSKWLIPLNLYIRRWAITWATSCFLNFSKIFYSKKVFFVPSDDHFFAYVAKLQVGVATHTKGGGA